jgi:hypothetical protein
MTITSSVLSHITYYFHLQTTTTIEKQQSNVAKSPPRVVINTRTGNLPSYSYLAFLSNILAVEQPSPVITNIKPVPLASVNTLLHGNSITDNNQQHNESPMAQVRSYVEKQMDQLQQDLEFGFSRGPKTTPSSSTPIPARVFIFKKN